MRATSGVLVATLMLAASHGTAWAEPTSDIAGWAKRFTEAALKSDVDAIVDTVKDISDPRLNIDSVRSVVQAALGVTKGETPNYREQFPESTVGSFIKRINAAVRYSKDFIFHSIVLVRTDKGCQLAQINIDGNLNKILGAPWPS